jgi:hypothetical protein
MPEFGVESYLDPYVSSNYSPEITKVHAKDSKPLASFP